MKNLFGIAIFLLLAFPVFAEEPRIFLTNQNGVQTTQFEIDDEIYIEGICLPAQEVVKIYITHDKTWHTGDELSDVSSGIETFMGSVDGKIPRTKIWNKPLNQGTYDVVIDTNSDSALQEYEKQCIIGVTDAGFRVGNPAPPLPPAEKTPSSPPPASTPPPPPPPLPAKPSVVFLLNEHVETKSLSNIRKSPGGVLIGAQDQGALGVVVGGPIQASLSGNNYWFWNINFEDDPDGWVAASMLKSAPAPVEKIATEKNTAEPLVDTVTADTATTVIKEIPQKEIATEKMLAQVSGIDGGSDLNPFMGSIIMGAALFFGLIFGSIIIARALRRN